MLTRITSYLIGLSIMLLASCHSSRQLAVGSNSSPQLTVGKGVTNTREEGNIHQQKSAPLPYQPPRKKELRKKYAAILQVPSKKIKNYRLYYFVDEWYGVHYKYGGNNKTGIDCSALVQQLYSNVYEAKLRRTTSMQYEDSRKVKKIKRLKEGYLVFFHPSGEKVAHVGIYLRNKYFLHASNSGVTINNLDEKYWNKCFVAGGKVK